MNSLPRPAPSLRASMVPPCISTSRARERQADAEAALAARVVGRPSRLNISKMRGSASGAMPMPLSRTLIAHRRRPRAAPTARCAPPSCGVLGGVVEQVGEDLREPHRIAVQPQRLGGQRDARAGGRAAWIERLAGLDGVAHDRRQLDALAPQLEACRGVMRDISSRSSTRRTRWLTWRSMMSRIAPALARRRPAAAAACSALRSGASGLRSSCASVARNSSLRRSASRSALARRSRSRRCRWTVADHAVTVSPAARMRSELPREDRSHRGRGAAVDRSAHAVRLAGVERAGGRRAPRCVGEHAPVAAAGAMYLVEVSCRSARACRRMNSAAATGLHGDDAELVVDSCCRRRRSACVSKALELRRAPALSAVAASRAELATSATPRRAPAARAR